MSNRLSPEKAKAIATEYLTNGLRKVDALLACGYAPVYARKGGLKLWDNIVLKDAIAQIQAKQAIKLNITPESITEELQEVKLMALSKTDCSSATRCIELKGKIGGVFEADNRQKSGEDKVLGTLTDEEKDYLRGIAKRMTAIKAQESQKAG
ncbi:MAG: hypothetical protein PHY56_04105 [Candidatus Omnitrophica bacterium]|nr:hypothetical protein [Candidatus Omnitrophota bacterium]